MKNVIKTFAVATLVTVVGTLLLKALSASEGWYYAFPAAVTSVVVMRLILFPDGVPPAQALPLRTIGGSFLRTAGLDDDPLPAAETIYAVAPGADGGTGAEPGEIALQRRATRLRVGGLRVLDLTDARVVRRMGLRPDEVAPRAPLIVGSALSHGADGLLTPSSDGDLLAIFPGARAELAIEDEQLVLLALPDSIADPLVRERLAEDGDLLHGFAEALEGGGFDEWLEAAVAPAERLRFEAAGLALGASAAAYSHFR